MMYNRIDLKPLPNLARRNGMVALSAALSAFAFVPAAPAKATIITFDPPNAQELHVIGISNAGVIGGDYNPGSNSHGFLRATDGTFTTFDPAGSQTTYVYGMNNKGATVGWYDDPNRGAFAFVRSAKGTFADIVPANSQGAIAPLAKRARRQACSSSSRGCCGLPRRSR